MYIPWIGQTLLDLTTASKTTWEGLLFDNRGNVSFSLSFLPLFPGDCCVAAAPHVDEHANKASLQPRGEKGSEK